MLVWALARLSREGSLAILSLVHRLKIFGVKVMSYQESWTEAPGEQVQALSIHCFGIPEQSSAIIGNNRQEQMSRMFQVMVYFVRYGITAAHVIRQMR